MPIIIPTVWNPDDKGTSVVLNQNGRDATSNHYSSGAVRTVYGASSGKYYAEFKGTPQYIMLGVGTGDAPVNGPTAQPGGNNKSWALYFVNGRKYHNDLDAAYFPRSLVAADVVGFALDMDAKTITGYLNGVSAGVMYSDLPSPLFFMFGSGAYATSNVHANFGQDPFAYPVPASHQHGFGTLIAANRIAGLVLDKDGNPAQRQVFVHDRASGNLVGQAISNAMGMFEITAPTLDPVYAVALDDEADDLFNALIFDRILPIPEY